MTEVAEAAAVPVIDDIRGRMVEMYVSLKPGVAAGPEMEAKVTKAIETEIGKIARPKNVWIVSDMPKTRSGKIMRRVIASVSNFADVGDVTTLANPEVVYGSGSMSSGPRSPRATPRVSCPRPSWPRSSHSGVSSGQRSGPRRKRWPSLTYAARLSHARRAAGPETAPPHRRRPQPGYTATVRCTGRRWPGEPALTARCAG